MPQSIFDLDISTRPFDTAIDRDQDWESNIVSNRGWADSFAPENIPGYDLPDEAYFLTPDGYEIEPVHPEARIEWQ